MIFWDSSAIVPLLLRESGSKDAERVGREDESVLVWWATRVECLSAIARRERSGELEPSDARQARTVLERLSESWNEIMPTPEVREHAGRLLRRHPLTAADALQLGAALTWARSRPTNHVLFTLDDRLAAAAELEGFQPA